MYRLLPSLAALLVLCSPVAIAQDSNRNAKLSSEAAERTAARVEYRQKMAHKRRIAEHRKQAERVKHRETPEGSKKKHEQQPATELKAVSEEGPAQFDAESDAEAREKPGDEKGAK